VKGMGRILLRVLAGAFALVMLLSLQSYHPLDPHPFSQGGVEATIHNLCGTFGALVAGTLQTLLGMGAWLFPFYILWECFPSGKILWPRRVAWAVLAFSVWTFLGGLGPRLWHGEAGQVLELRWGGWFGRTLWPHCRKLLGPVGTPLVLGLLVALALTLLAPALARGLGNTLARWFGKGAQRFKPLPAKGAQSFLTMLKRPFKRIAPQRDLPDLDAQDLLEIHMDAERQEREEESIQALNRAEREAATYRKANRGQELDLDLPVIQSLNLDAEGASQSAQSARAAYLVPLRYATPSEALPPPLLLRNLPPPPTPKTPLVLPKVEKDAYGRVMEQQPLGLTEPTPAHPLPPTPGYILPPTPGYLLPATGGHPLPPTPGPMAAPVLRAGGAKAEKPKAKEYRETLPEYPGIVDRLELPPRRLFDPPRAEERQDMALLEAVRDLVQAKFTEFKVKGTVSGLQPGPVVTVYEFQPDPGVPVAKVLSMEEDLALGLQAEKVRIDRIPGRNLVGIEVPNRKREIISFREVVDSPAFRDPSQKDARSLLTLALGKDMAGHPVVADLAKMPHLLIGGSTGSGKSVGVNAMICSLLLRALPHEVKLILVDPKMVELGIYEDIPHLWAPVVTDMKEAGRVLKWVVAQMEDRYKRLALLSVRNLEGFNAKVMDAGGEIDLSDRTPNPRWPERPSVLEPLPYVVVIIDELADLMMVCRADVEESIARIAQKARAVGIHLILATQRPSVDIVTGVIKANLPCRLSYRVNTKIDSRTILDSGGGEQLLGKGDALFLAPGSARPKRIHAPLLTEEETLRLVEWLKERGKPDYNHGLLSAMETDDESGGATEELVAAGDDIYERAVAVVKRERKASTSLLQRKLNIGYGRAARIIDRMEDEGIIGGDRGAGKPREVLTGEE